MSNNKVKDEIKQEKKISDKTLTKTAWRVMLFENSVNFERMQSFSFTYAILPILKELYKNTEDLIQGIKRHLQFFNSNVLASSFIVGAAASMEEKKANGEPLTDEAINSVKVGLMGPGSGIGDALFWGTFVPLVGGLAAAIGSNGHILAPILHQIIRVGLWILVIHFGVKFGYREGLNILEKAGEKGIENITQGAIVLASTVIGGLVATLVNAKTELVMTLGDVKIDVQADILDSIAPNIIPLLLFVLVYNLISKRKWSPTTVIMFVFVIGISASFLKILAIP